MNVVASVSAELSASVGPERVHRRHAQRPAGNDAQEVGESRSFATAKWSAVRGKEVQTLKDFCSVIQSLSIQQRHIIGLKKLGDLNSLRDMMDKAEDDDLMAHFDTEALVAIINPTVRSQVLKGRLMAKMSDEQELSAVIQQHKDDFAQMLWKRRLAVKKDLRELFQTGPGVICKFGEVISDVSLDIIQSLERHQNITLCKNAIAWGLASSDDIPGNITRTVVLLAPNGSQFIQLSSSRLEFSLSSNNQKISTGWFCVFASHGLWSSRLLSKPLQLELVNQTELNVMRHLSTTSGEVSYMHLIARLIDALHPGFQLQASVLAYPLYAMSILKRRLVQLGYETSPSVTAQGSPPESSVGPHATTVSTATAISGRVTGAYALELIRRAQSNLSKSCRFYFEFTCHAKPLWRIGFKEALSTPLSLDKGYPGEDAHSFGFSYNGNIYYDNYSFPYLNTETKDLQQKQDSKQYTNHVWGVIVDLAVGNICLVCNGKELPPAFGAGATIFDQKTQTNQIEFITKKNLIPMFALKGHSQEPDNGGLFLSKPEIRVNFGSNPFINTVHAVACTQLLQFEQIKSSESIAILESSADDMKGNANQEEEERLQLVLEKNYFRASVFTDTERCWSQFPPSVYRRSLASTKIQRAWRIYRGRKWRRELRAQQYAAATKIQHAVKKALVKIRATKNAAAALIQRNWRKTCFVWIALLRCRYRKTLPQLHHAAQIIQTRFRRWIRVKASPLVNQYNAKLEDLAAAVNVIIKWWRPRYARLIQRRELAQRYKAASDIQRVWHGYRLRKLIRPDLRLKLQTLGEHLAKHRNELMRIQAAYTIQTVWRIHRVRRIRAEKTRTRNAATTRLQALWKGYWVRSQISVRFNYGEALFLGAVRKALRNCYFIPKMYRPCGIVCPKRETRQRVFDDFLMGL